MASDKQKRKAARGAKPRKPGAPHPDSDRRRRGGLTADQGMRDKKARREFPGLPMDQ